MAKIDDILSRTVTFVLAGGEGRRLLPLTEQRPKPILPFGGVYRLLDFTLSNCFNSQIPRAHVLTQHRCDSIHQYLRLGWNCFDPGRPQFAVPQPPASGKRYRGSADAVFENAYLFAGPRPPLVLVLAADHVYRMDYRPLLRFHVERGASVTIAANARPAALSAELGVLDAEPGGRVAGFEEKPRFPAGGGIPNEVLASMGVYVFNAEVLLRASAALCSSRPTLDFGRDMIPFLLDTVDVCAYRFENSRGAPRYWRDVGTLDSYVASSMDLLGPAPRFRPYDGRWPVRIGSRFQAWRELDSSGRATGPDDSSIIPHGAITNGAGIRRSILSPGVRCGSSAQVRDSILMPGAQIGAGASIVRTVVEEYAQVLPGEEIGYDLEKDRQRFNVTPGGYVVVTAAGRRGPEFEAHAAVRASRLRAARGEKRPAARSLT